MAKKTTTLKLILAALFVALGILFPSLFHLFGAGPVFLPMYIPVILAAFVCGPVLGALCGILTVLLSSIITGMPPMIPVMPIMMCELAIYGLITGMISQKTKNIFAALIPGMIAGRLVNIAATYVVYSVISKSVVVSALLTSLFVTAWPGLLLQIILIPVIIYAFKKVKLIS